MKSQLYDGAAVPKAARSDLLLVAQLADMLDMYLVPSMVAHSVVETDGESAGLTVDLKGCWRAAPMAAMMALHLEDRSA